LYAQKKSRLQHLCGHTDHECIYNPCYSWGRDWEGCIQTILGKKLVRFHLTKQARHGGTSLCSQLCVRQR
jgi:hypothetical protein